MKSFFALLALSLITSNTFAQSKSDLSSVKMIEVKADYKKFKFQDTEVYTISTKKFGSQKAAETFCESQKMTLDKEGSAILIAMSGVTNSNKFLREAISYKFVDKGYKESGIWYWAGVENKIVLVKDGGGKSSETITPSDYEKLLKKKPEIPAICTIDLKKVAKDVNEALVEVKSDKTSDRDIKIQNGSRNFIKGTTPEIQSPSQESRGITK